MKKIFPFLITLSAVAAAVYYWFTTSLSAKLSSDNKSIFLTCRVGFKTYKHTYSRDGYGTSIVDMGRGYKLDMGRNQTGTGSTLKIEFNFWLIKNGEQVETLIIDLVNNKIL
jgi:hypothetical protein